MKLATDETIKPLEYLKETTLNELHVLDTTETSDIIHTTTIVYRQACKLMKTLMNEHLSKEIVSGEYATFIYHQTILAIATRCMMELERRGYDGTNYRIIIQRIKGLGGIK